MKPIIAIPAIAALIYRAWSHKSLTPVGIFAAFLTALAHTYHPWNLPFALLAVFFLAGSRVTKIKSDVKAKLTIPSKGSSGGEGPRTHVQVFANSLCASVLTLLHAYQLRQRKNALADPSLPDPEGTLCYSWGGDILVVGIIANYAVVAADTFSSELGILSKSQPRLITSWNLRRVPPGTNGGVTLFGLAAGFFGSMLIVATAMLLLPVCGPNTPGLSPSDEEHLWDMHNRGLFMWGLTVWGFLGSVVDSILGGLFQRSVRDTRTGKIVEGEGGVRVLASPLSEKEHAETFLATGVVESALLSGEGTHAVEHTDASLRARKTTDPTDDDVSPRKYDAKNRHRRPSFGDARPTRVVESGLDWLDNNDVNFIMAVLMSVGAMAFASWWWEIPLSDIMLP